MSSTPVCSNFDITESFVLYSPNFPYIRVTPADYSLTRQAAGALATTCCLKYFRPTHPLVQKMAGTDRLFNKLETTGDDCIL